VHGRNRLIGNSTLELFVFGRRAGCAAAEYTKKVKLGKLSLEHVRRWQKDLEQAGLAKVRPISPLLLPDYARRIPDYMPDSIKETLPASRMKLT
jgi:succinate dehydrogenase / fumarate reductase flavoprotein subunit